MPGTKDDIPPMKRLRQVIALVLVTAITAGFLVWYLGKVENVGEVWKAFKEARLWVAPFAALVGLAVFPIKAVRWRLLLPGGGRIPLRTLFSAIMIGFMANCILLFRLGELVRAAALGIKKQASTAEALASIALERIFDMVAIVLILIAALLLIQPAAGPESAKTLAKLRTAGVFAAMLFAVGIAFLVLLRSRPRATTAFVLGCVFWMPVLLREKVRDFLKSFLQGLDAVQSAEQVVTVFALSIVHWMVQVAFYYLVGQCFPGLGLTFAGAMLVFSLVALSVAAPPLPGYLVVFQAGIAAAGLVLSLPPGPCFSYAWLAWAMNVPPVIVVGFVCLWWEGLSLGQLRKNANRDA